jgi:hypothetical protein
MMKMMHSNSTVDGVYHVHPNVKPVDITKKKNGFMTEATFLP